MNTVTRKRFSIQEYHQLIELGFFSPSPRVELIRGEIFTMVAKGTAHTACCTKLIRELGKLLADKAILRCQDPIVLPSASEPEPDFTIAKNKSDDYLSCHPQPEDIFLVIEVADSSLNYDQETKLALYGESNILDYWIVNLLDEQLQTYSQPYQKRNGEYGYLNQQIFLPNQQINLPGFPSLILDLNRIFHSKDNS